MMDGPWTVGQPQPSTPLQPPSPGDGPWKLGQKPADADRPPSELSQQIKAFGHTVAQEGRDWWGEFHDYLAQAGEDELKSIRDARGEARDSQKHTADLTTYAGESLVTGGKLFGETLLNLGNAVWSPIGAALDVGVVKPVQQNVITPIGNQVAKVASNTPVPDKGVDWKIHPKDVTDTTQAINDFFSFAVQTAAGLVTGDDLGFEAPRKPGSVVEAAPPSPKARTKAASSLETAFDELATRNPEAATQVAEAVAKADPEAAKAMKSVIAQATKKDSPSLIEQIKATKDDLAKAQTDREAAEIEGKLNALTKGTAAGRAISVGEASARVAFEGDERVGANLWGDLHVQMEQHYEGLYADREDLALPNGQVPFDPHGPSSKPVGAHDLLDRMLDKLKNAKTAGQQAARSLLTTLRAKVDNVPVRFREHLELEGHQNVWGIYDSGPHSIDVVLNRGTTQTLVHELVHAATVKFFMENPEHPLTQEMKRLYEITQGRILDHAMKGGGIEYPYGMTNVLEFVAEALSNPQFQNFLIRSEQNARANEGLKNLYTRFVDLIQRILGIGKDGAQLLNNVVRTGHEIIEAQAAARMEAGARGLSKASREVLASVAHDDPWQPRDIPAVHVMQGKLKEYWRQILRTVHPEGLSREAAQAGATLARNLAEQVMADTNFIYKARERQRFWNRNPQLIREFVAGYEKGTKFTNPVLAKAQQAYENWSADILAQDKALGIEYDPVDHYFPHLFQDQKGVEEWLTRQFGSSWTKPGFSKERSFSAYEQAIKADFQPRYTNPEDIMLARQHASDIAKMKVQTLRGLEQTGLAVKAEKGEKIPDWAATRWPGPDGQAWWVHNDAAVILNNAFKTTSLWSMKGIGGDLFRGAMNLKNALVPLKLAVSLFHPLHVQTIDNATSMVRATKLLLSGASSPVQWFREMVGSAAYKDILNNPRQGSAILRAYRGQVKNLSDADRLSLQYMTEGGLIPEMSAEMRLKSQEQFRAALERHSATAAFHLPGAVMNALQAPIFNHWIPSLKIASYLKDVQTALKADSSLLTDPAKRQLAFRKLAKSVDNRYGEMSYNTLFWPRFVKDLAVSNTLSLGWTLGFLREYGGGMIDLGKAAGRLAKGEKVSEIAKSGGLDRPLFVSFYTTQALAYGGLMTWALTGKSPASLLDYVYPRTGGKNPDGSDTRVSTMFYTREIAGIAKHIQQEGVASGLSGAAANKGWGLAQIVGEWARGVDNFGREIRDPNAPAYKQLEQTLAQTLKELEPISLGQWGKQSGKERALSVAGFSPAPKYVTESATSSAISQTYDKYYAPKQTAFDKAVRSKETSSLRDLWNKGDTAGFDKGLQELQAKYNLTGSQIKELVRSMARGESGEVAMFKEFSAQQQLELAKRMTPAERQRFLPYAKRQIRSAFQ